MKARRPIPHFALFALSALTLLAVAACHPALPAPAVEAQWKLARQAYAAQHFAEAELRLREVLRHPGMARRPEVRMLLAKTLFFARRTEEARRVLRRAERDGLDGALLWLARLDLAEGRYPLEDRLLQRVAAFPEDAPTWMVLAEMSLRRGDVQAGRERLAAAGLIDEGLAHLNARLNRMAARP